MAKLHHCYVHWYQKHRPDDVRILRLGNHVFMRWDCVRWHLEEKMGLHNGKWQNACVMASYADEDAKEYFGDDVVITGRRILEVRVVPYWYQFDYNPKNPRSAPLRGPVYHPAPIRAFYKEQGILLPASFV